MVLAPVLFLSMCWPCICAGGRMRHLPWTHISSLDYPNTTSCRPHFRSTDIITSNRLSVSLQSGQRKLTISSWLYLFFFNGLWVVVPAWILYEAYRAMSSAMSQAEMVDLVNYLKKDD
jgi:hypothetical protein